MLENFYLCGIKHNPNSFIISLNVVVICLKISIFVVSNTTISHCVFIQRGLWFAWKFLSLWYQTQRFLLSSGLQTSCDLLENFYLCGIKHNHVHQKLKRFYVVICLKISIFVVSNTTYFLFQILTLSLWFAWKFLSLWYQTQLAVHKVRWS